MSRLFFALADAWLWSQWHPSFQRQRRRRADAWRLGDRRMMGVWHDSMRMAKTFAFGEWRSLWGVL